MSYDTSLDLQAFDVSFGLIIAKAVTSQVAGVVLLAEQWFKHCSKSRMQLQSIL